MDSKRKLNKKINIRTRKIRFQRLRILRNIIGASLCLLVLCLIINFSNEGIKIKSVKTSPKNKVTESILTDENVKSNYRITIDAGHGGYDEGTTSIDNINEKDVTLSISLKIGAILEKNDIDVIYTRKNDNVTWPSYESEDLRKRVKISEDNKSDMFISIHCNGSEDDSSSGIETWTRYPGTDGEHLAEMIQSELVNINYSNDRGIKYESDGYLAVLQQDEATSVLVELGFLTNSDDSSFITSESGQVKISEAISKAIIEYVSHKRN